MIKNVFSSLCDEGFEITEILAVDILHEFELGVWKSVLEHLLRMLFAISSDTVRELNERYLALP